jgi:site-specific recombinase XerD
MSRNLLIKEVGDLDSHDIRYNGYQSQLDYEFFENFDSEHTKAAYKRDLVQFFQFVSKEFGQINYPHQLQKMHVIAFRNAIRAPKSEGGQSYCPKTIIRKLATITSYCAFLIEKGLMTTNPTAHIKRPKDEVITATNDLSDDQVKAVLDSVDLSKKSGPLHKAILVLLFSTGMRKGELINLKFTDYQEHQGLKIIQYIGKRGKVSRVPLHPAAIFHLEHYIRYMESKGHQLKGDDHLFQGLGNNTNSQSNKKLQATSIDYIIKYHCKKVGITANISPHSARATVIGSLLESGCDLYKVSQLVNHSNVKTTQEYDKRKKSLIDSPVFKLKYF